MTRRLGFVLLAAVASGCGGGASWPKEADLATAEPGVIAVTHGPVQNRRVQRTVEAVGTLYGYEEVAIAAKVEGRVARILHDVADRVKPGDELLLIDPTEYQLSVEQSRRALEVEWSRLGLAGPPGQTFDPTAVPPVIMSKAQLDNARGRFERVQSLATKQAVTREEVADKAAAFQVAKAEYENQILLAKASLATARMRQESLALSQQALKETTIRVPVPTKQPAGVKEAVYAITERTVAEGSYVRPGIEVFHLVIENPLKLRCRIPERHASEIAVGQPASITTATYAEPFSGTVTRINPSVDRANRTFEVEILAPNDAGRMKPGAFAKGAIQTRVDENATTVPLEAVVTFAGITKVFALEDGKAREIRVELGVQGDRWVEVTKPAIKEGTLVATSGLSSLYDGAAVRERRKDAKTADEKKSSKAEATP